jgi:hypothetical protein
MASTNPTAANHNQNPAPVQPTTADDVDMDVDTESEEESDDDTPDTDDMANMQNLLNEFNERLDGFQAVNINDITPGKDIGEIIKPPLPKPFTGKPNDLEPFLTGLRAYFRFFPNKLRNAEDKVFLAGSLLHGTAGQWFEPIQRERLTKLEYRQKEETQQIFAGFKGFAKALRRMFGTADEKHRAEQRIMNLKQTGSTADYVAVLQQENAILQWDDEPLMVIFERGLKREVLDELDRDDRPKKFGDYAAKAIKIDDRLYRRRRDQRGRQNEQRPRGRTPWGLQANQGKPRQPQRIAYGHTLHAGPMELGAIKKDRKEVTCYKCGKKGHMQRECRSSSKWTPIPEGKATNTRQINTILKGRSGYSVRAVNTIRVRPLGSAEINDQPAGSTEPPDASTNSQATQSFEGDEDWIRANEEYFSQWLGGTDQWTRTEREDHERTPSPLTLDEPVRSAWDQMTEDDWAEAASQRHDPSRRDTIYTLFTSSSHTYEGEFQVEEWMDPRLCRTNPRHYQLSWLSCYHGRCLTHGKANDNISRHWATPVPLYYGIGRDNTPPSIQELFTRPYEALETNGYDVKHWYGNYAALVFHYLPQECPYTLAECAGPCITHDIEKVRIFDESLRTEEGPNIVLRKVRQHDEYEKAKKQRQARRAIAEDLHENEICHECYPYTAEEIYQQLALFAEGGLDFITGKGPKIAQDACLEFGNKIRECKTVWHLRNPEHGKRPGRNAEKLARHAACRECHDPCDYHDLYYGFYTLMLITGPKPREEILDRQRNILAKCEHDFPKEWTINDHLNWEQLARTKLGCDSCYTQADYTNMGNRLKSAHQEIGEPRADTPRAIRQLYQKCSHRAKNE